jgi:tetratricopeptide (TPR) repeat protein
LRACSFITSAFSVKRSALNVPTPASTANCQLPTANCQLLLTLAFILAWFLSILPFFVSGQYRQPILPLLALLAAPYIDQLLSAFSVKRSALNVELQTQTLNAQRSTPNAHPAPDSHTPIAPHTHTLTHSLVLLHFRTLALLTIFLFLTHLNPLGYAPSRALPLYNAACSAKLQGDLADALARYRDLAGLPERIQASGDAPLRPNELAFCAMAAGNMGTLEFNAGNPYRAERAYRQAIAFEPGNANARANLGAALLAQGRHAEAEEVLLEVLLNDPARTYARLTLVQSLLAQGRRDAAAPHLRILAADPAAADGLKQIRAQHPELGW